MRRSLPPQTKHKDFQSYGNHVESYVGHIATCAKKLHFGKKNTRQTHNSPCSLISLSVLLGVLSLCCFSQSKQTFPHINCKVVSYPLHSSWSPSLFADKLLLICQLLRTIQYVSLPVATYCTVLYGRLILQTKKETNKPQVDC